MKTVLSAVLLLVPAALSARPLPYAVTLEETPTSGRLEISLKEAADEAVRRWAAVPEPDRSLRAFLRAFDETLLAKVEGANAWQDPRDPVKRTRSALFKWINTYSAQASSVENQLDALTEYERSKRFVMDLASKGVEAADRDRPAFRKDSHWCGASDDTCSDGMLYKVVQAPGNAVHGSLREAVDRALRDASADPSRRAQIHLVNYQLLWDPPSTRIRYSVCFYFFEDGEPSPDLLGYDLFYANEATPAEWSPENPGAPAALSPETPWQRIKYASAYPFGVVIGIKNAAFELAKTPFSFVGGFFGRGRPLDYTKQNFKTAGKALWVELRYPKKEGPVRGLLRLVGDLPFVGQVFQYNTNPDRADLAARKRIYLTRGIYGGDRAEQDTGLWLAATRRYYPEAVVTAAPHEHGTVTDVVWSLFNLSHGQAYDLADRIMSSAGRGDRLYLAGHSAGVQRITMASRILNHHGYDVRQMMGLAGPSLGQASVNTLHPEPFKILLNPAGDVVSLVGAGAKGVSLLVDAVTRRPAKWILGLPLRLINDREHLEGVERLMDKAGVSNASPHVVRPGLPAKHETPFRLSMTNRVVFDRFVLQEYRNHFRDDIGYVDGDKKKGIPFRE